MKKSYQKHSWLSAILIVSFCLSVSVDAFGADLYYEVWRSESVNPDTAIRLQDWWESTSYDDDKGTSGQHYYYWIRVVTAETKEAYKYSPGSGVSMFLQIKCPIAAETGTESPIRVRVAMSTLFPPYAVGDLTCRIREKDLVIDNTMEEWTEYDVYVNPGSDIYDVTYDNTWTKDIIISDYEIISPAQVYLWSSYLHQWAIDVYNLEQQTDSISVTLRDYSDDPPSTIRATQGTYTDKVRVTWDPVSVSENRNSDLSSGFVGWVSTEAPNPDLNGDFFVNFVDFAMLAPHWMETCSEPNFCEGADLNHDKIVDCNDLAIMAEDWLKLMSLDDGLVAYWSFDEGSGITAHDVIGGNNGILNGDPIWVDGISGKALYFDGSGDYVDVPNSPDLNPTSAITIAAWINWHSFTTTWPPIVKKHSETPFYGYSLEMGANSTVHLSLETDGPERLVTDLVQIPKDEWHFIVGVYDGSTGNLYVDGTPETPKSVSGSILHSSTHLNIGHDSVNPSRYFDGVIDEVRIYNRALTSAEIEYLYQNP